MRDYTPEELLRGRFLRHFMGLETRFEDDPTEEQVAVPASASPQPAKVRFVQRPRRMERARPVTTLYGIEPEMSAR